MFTASVTLNVGSYLAGHHRKQERRLIIGILAADERYNNPINIFNSEKKNVPVLVFALAISKNLFQKFMRVCSKNFIKNTDKDQLSHLE